MRIPQVCSSKSKCQFMLCFIKLCFAKHYGLNSQEEHAGGCPFTECYPVTAA